MGEPVNVPPGIITCVGPSPDKNNCLGKLVSISDIRLLMEANNGRLSVLVKYPYLSL